VNRPDFKPVATTTSAGAARMVPRGDQCRCACGSMLARVVQEGLELKCRKCKSLILIRHEELIEMYGALGFELRPTMPKSPFRPRG
jgi:hypothetical protein